MKASLKDHARWPWWLAAGVATALLVMWRQPWVDTASPVPVMPPAVAVTKTVSAADLGSPDAAQSKVTAHAPAFTLIGTAIGDRSIASLRRKSDAQLLLLRVGDRVDGLTVTAIESNRVVLTGAAQAIVLEADRPVATPAPPVPRPAASPPPPPPSETPAYAAGEAPWDAGPNFRH